MAEYDLVIGVSLHLGQRRGDFWRRELHRRPTGQAAA